MGKQTGRILFSIFLIAAGVLALLANLNVLRIGIDLEQPLLATLFAVGGLAFLATFLSAIRENWWAIIPAMVLGAIALLIGFPMLEGAAGGPVFLGMLALSFWIIFLTAPRQHWWAIIPGGVLLTLAAMATNILDRIDGSVQGAVFFLGIGLTFGVVFLSTRARWALWPAGILVAMGSLLLLTAGGIAAMLLPALLIVLGGLLVVRAFQPKHG